MNFFPFEFFKRIIYCFRADRIGPDLSFTHWLLQYKSTGQWLSRRKFKQFADSAEFRPGSYAITCSNISIGKRVVIRPGSYLESDPRPNQPGIVIEDDVMLSPYLQIYVKDHAFGDLNRPIIDQGYGAAQEVRIKRGSWIGSNVIILKGVTIGENSVIGAGSVVTKNIPARVVAAGNPARVIKLIE